MWTYIIEFPQLIFFRQNVANSTVWCSKRWKPRHASRLRHQCGPPLWIGTTKEELTSEHRLPPSKCWHCRKGRRRVHRGNGIVLFICESVQHRGKLRWNQIKALLTQAVECVLAELAFYCTVNQESLDCFTWTQQMIKTVQEEKGCRPKNDRKMQRKHGKSPDCVGKDE